MRVMFFDASSLKFSKGASFHKQYELFLESIWK